MELFSSYLTENFLLISRIVGVRSYPARNTRIGIDSPLTGAPSIISYLKNGKNQLILTVAISIVVLDIQVTNSSFWMVLLA